MSILGFRVKGFETPISDFKLGFSDIDFVMIQFFEFRAKKKFEFRSKNQNFAPYGRKILKNRPEIRNFSSLEIPKISF